MESAHEVQTNKWTLEGVNTVNIQCILWSICGGKEGGGMVILLRKFETIVHVSWTLK